MKEGKEHDRTQPTRARLTARPDASTVTRASAGTGTIAGATGAAGTGTGTGTSPDTRMNGDPAYRRRKLEWIVFAAFLIAAVVLVGWALLKL